MNAEIISFRKLKKINYWLMENSYEKPKTINLNVNKFIHESHLNENKTDTGRENSLSEGDVSFGILLSG